MKGFSFPYDPEVHAAARGSELNISPKAAREVCRAIKGMELENAKSIKCGHCSKTYSYLGIKIFDVIHKL